MANWTELKTRVLETLGDPGGARHAASLLDEAARQALEEYSLALPQLKETVFTAAETGSSQAIAGAERLLFALEVFYPHDPAAPCPAPCEDWRASVENGAHVLAFGGGLCPRAGESIRVRYAAGHTLEGLDGAALTSLPEGDEGLLAQGAAGHAALMRSAGMAQAYGKRNPQDEVARLGEQRLEAFRRALSGRRGAGWPAQPWTARWKLDAWDEG